MNRMTRLAAATLLLVGISPHVVVGQDIDELTEDVAASVDHPMLRRIPGSIIVQYQSSDFDEGTLILGRHEQSTGFDSTLVVEGRTTRITYRLPESGSTVLGVRAYQSALERGGFGILFECGDAECFSGSYWRSVGRLHGYEPLTEIVGRQQPGPAVRYLAARRETPDGTTFVSVLAHDHRVFAGVFLRLWIFEEQDLGIDLLGLDAHRIAAALETSGRIELEGVLFETDEAVLLDSSEPALEAMKEYLRNAPDAEVYIVGHTDGLGALDHNIELSTRRAEAVVDALIERGISDSRMTPMGIGPLAPLASNATEEGRARNRRVELVLR